MRSSKASKEAVSVSLLMEAVVRVIVGSAYPKSRNVQIREAEQDYNESRKSFTDELITKPREVNSNSSDDKKSRDFTEQQNKSYKEQEIKRICLEIRKKVRMI